LNVPLKWISVWPSFVLFMKLAPMKSIGEPTVIFWVDSASRTGD